MASHHISLHLARGLHTSELLVSGYIDDAGNPVDTFTGLSRALHPQFKLGYRENIPFVIRETGRKHQHTIAELTAWNRIE